jgi:hypothetical protein
MFNKRPSLRKANGDVLIDLFADKVSGRSYEGDFDQTADAASTRVEAAHVVLAIEPAASAGERRCWVVVGVVGVHFSSLCDVVGEIFLE